MKQRIITGVIGVAAIALILISNELVLGITIALLSLWAMFEMCSAIGLNKKMPLMVLGLIFSLVASFGEKLAPNLIMPLIFVYIVALFVIMLVNRKTVSFTDISVLFFMSAYVLYTLAHIVFVRNMTLGAYNIFLIVVGSFATDTFAYFTGVFFGRKKLCPEISPKKTVEGAVGGFLGCVLCIVLTGAAVEAISGVTVNYVALTVLGALCATAAQIGDLSASIIKRQYNIKDFGNLLPGHGGIMDRLDSIIFVAPLVYYFITFFPVFTA